MEAWLRQRLTDCLQFPVPDEMITFILSMNDAHVLDNYFESLLDFSLPEHRLFLNDLKQRMFKKSASPVDARNNNNAPAKKNPLVDRPPNNKNRDAKPKTSNAQRKSSESSVAAAAPSDPSSDQKPTSTGTKKKTKYVSLYDEQNPARDVVLLKGRHHCDCQAVRHALVNNCLQCGRIVCEQEGSGPCLFCGQLVCRDDELSLIESSSKKGEALRRSLMQQKRPKGWEEAMAMRNKLLEFDRTSEKRTTVIDDESDYFQSDSVWLNDAERAKIKQLESEMHEKRHASRLAQRVTLDFSGRTIVEEPRISEEYEEQVRREIADAGVIQAGIARNMQLAAQAADGAEQPDDVHPLMDFPAPMFDPSIVSGLAPKTTTTSGYDGVYNRVQDRELLEIADQSRCISMHQPYASLLVAGIKRHEGRSWYASHRGRLWIAATAKTPDAEEVRSVQQFYRKHYGDEKLPFPGDYPTGCLLGCVTVQDCLPQEDYRRLHPEGESESPFVFVCSEPQELPIRFPMRGEHKIYKLDHSVHMAACKAIQRASKVTRDVDEQPALVAA